MSPTITRAFRLIVAGERSASTVFRAWSHPINKIERLRPGHFVSFLSFIRMIMIVLGGIAGRYVRRGILKDYWRTLQIPLTVRFYFTLAFHILEKTEAL